MQEEKPWPSNFVTAEEKVQWRVTVMDLANNHPRGEHFSLPGSMACRYWDYSEGKHILGSIEVS